jgi:hypothetical protein
MMPTPKTWALAIAAFAVTVVGSGLGVGLGAPRAVAGPVHAERVVCREVPETERDAARLTNPEHLRSVREIAHAARTGARLVLTAAPGLTVEGLQRIADCHLARLAATGNAARTSASPLDVKGAAVAVKSEGDAFAVDITAADPDAARTILARARALLPGRAKP